MLLAINVNNTHTLLGVYDGDRLAVHWRLRTDPQGRLVAYECGSVKGSNACVVDFLEEDLVAAVATNSWECCGWKKADALAAFFRSAR